VFAGISLFVSAMLKLALPKRTDQHEAGGAAMKQTSTPVMPTADTD